MDETVQLPRLAHSRPCCETVSFGYTRLAARAKTLGRHQKLNWEESSGLISMSLKSVKPTNNMCMKLISRLIRQNLLIRSKPILDNYVSGDHAVPVKRYTALGFLFWRIKYLPYWQIHLVLFSLYSAQICADKSVVSCHLSIVYIMPFSKVLSLCSVPLIR